MTAEVPDQRPGQRIAVVGAGVSGLTAALYLSRQHEVTLFEANDYLGGHTHTHDIEIDGRDVRVDTGFIVYNERTYPNFIRLLTELGCRGRPTEMSFSVRDPGIGLEYNGRNLNTLFAQRRNLLRPRFYRLVGDIIRFNRRLRSVASDDDRSLDQFLGEEGFSDIFRSRYIVPMAAAIWSTGDQGINAFPVSTLATFFRNHGLIDLRGRPQWYVVDGGSDRYVHAIRRLLGDVVLDEPVKSVSRGPGSVTIRTERRTQEFDHVVMAAHSDQSLALLANPTREERDILGDIRYSRNEACLHTDAGQLPRRRRAWASWNYLIDPGLTDQATLTYNMNILQHIGTQTQVLVTLNDAGRVEPAKVIKRMTYSHPFFDHRTIAAQRRKAEISGRERTWYAGAYWGYGFHEDGVNSALDIVRHLGCPTP
ncbi:MAG: FAD-dependent oxidoreductase [Gammaproteobacteria bacterium]|nr:FAD-dependent oxidoreductase [Gammaproteobacteria bacterium]